MEKKLLWSPDAINFFFSFDKKINFESEKFFSLVDNKKMKKPSHTKPPTEQWQTYKSFFLFYSLQFSYFNFFFVW